ncbi:MAG TPA: alpha/beta hydrolase [Streptosporangiaceae bacterium]
MTTTTFGADLAETRYAEAPGGRFAYRRLGPRSTVPLVMATRFRGTIDHWDPALLEVLGSQRDVIMFDNRGTAASTGAPPDTIEGLAEGLLEFLGALGLTQVDLLGWSMGGYVVQVATIKRPELVRRLIVAGSGPGTVPDLPAQSAKVRQVVGKPVLGDDDFLYLFFPETGEGRRAGLASLRRLDARLSGAHVEVTPAAVAAQNAAFAAFGTGVWERLGELTLPVLVASGAHDVLIHAYASYAMSQRLPNAKVILYSDAGHAFLFQHSDDFGHEVLNFLQ